MYSGLGDAPAHVPVDHDALLLSREHGFGVDAVEHQQALVDVRNVLERRRHLEMQAGLGDHVLDLPQCIDHAELALVDHEQRGTEQRQEDQQRRNNKSNSIHDRLP
jgi:hypothetical protein